MKQSKNEIFALLKGSLTDISLARYKVYWGRISQMQQNASILLAVLSFTIASDFSLLHFTDFFTKNAPAVLPIFITTITLCLLTGFWLFKVIFPKILKDLPQATELNETIMADLKRDVFVNETDDDEVECKVNPTTFIMQTYLDKIDISVENIHQIVQKNQKNYLKGLLISIPSILLTVGMYISLALSLNTTDLSKTFAYLLIIIVLIFALIVSFKKNTI